jgi:hypothetical protein
MVIENLDIFISIVGTAVTIVAGMAGWAFRRMVKAQDRVAMQMQELSIAIAKICGNVETGIVWQNLHSRQDDERQAINVAADSRLLDLIVKLSAKAEHTKL